MELNLVMLGPPGAARARRHASCAGIRHSAHLHRRDACDAVQAGTPLGREVGAIMESGGLIDDEVITRVVRW